MPRTYNGGIASYAIWLAEFAQFIELYQSGKSIDEIKRRGVFRIRPARKGKDSILNGIQFIQQFKLVIHPRCTQFKVELENYTWKKDKATGEYINVPSDSYNHGIDAFRYSLFEIQRNMKKKIRATSRIY